MAISLGNRAKMTTSTTGTGTITLGSAVSGYQSFDAANITNGQTVRYAIEDGTAFEIGSGTYTSSGTTLTRSVTESSNSDSAITLTGNAEVFITATVADLYINDGASTLTTTGVITGGTVEATSDTAAGDNAAMGFTSAEGLILTGQGSTNDVTIKNDADADVLEIPTGTTNVTVAGNLGVGGTVTATGTSVFATLDISGDVDVDGTLESDAITLNGTAVTATATLDTGISNNNVPKFTSGVADNDFLRVDGTAIEGRSASEVLSDIAAAPAAGSSNIVTTGALNSGSITSGFGTIDTGSSNITTTGVGSFGSLDISGDIDVDGTTNLDVVDIDGAVDMASTLAVAGVVTANAGIVIDNITIDGTEIDLSSGDLTIDVAGDIILDADGGDINFQDGGVLYGFMAKSNDNLLLGNVIQDGDVLIRGNDGGSNITALSLDMSAAGAATFNSSITYSGDLVSSTSGTSNFRAGVNAGNSIQSGGNNNVVVGDEAGTSLTTGDSNVAVGKDALSADTLGSFTTAIGQDALANQNFTTATNTYNTAVGYDAGSAVTTGVQNTLIGGAAGDALTDADYNVGLGTGALSADTLGSKSTAIGTNTLHYQNFTTATDTFNTAVGYNAGLVVTTGIRNTFVGALAGDGTDDGGSNTAVGYGSLTSNCGDSNTAVGYASLEDVTGSNCTAVGQSAGRDVSSGSNNSFLGADSGRSGSPGGAITTASNTIVLGDGNVSACHIQTDWTVASDQRDKTDFTALDLGLDFVKALAPVTYKWDKRAKYGDITADDYDLSAQTPDGTHKEDWLDIGFKAQEVQALEEAAGYTTAAKKNLTVSTSGDGKQMGLQYSKFVPILVKAIQEQNALIEALTARVATLEG